MSSPPSIPPEPSRRSSLVDELDDALSEFGDSTVTTAFLVGLSGRRAGTLFRVQPGKSIIGRSSRAFLTLDEKAVSYKHAELTLSADSCRVVDLESTNGTFVNDIRINEAHTLSAGDVIRIGNNAFGFLTDAQDEQQHTRAMARLTAPRMPSLAVGPISVGPSSGGAHTQDARRTSHEIVPFSDHPVVEIFPQSSNEDEGNALDGALDKLELALGFIRRFWKRLLICTAIGGTAGSVMALMRPPVATATFEIFLRREAVPDPTRGPQTKDFSVQGGEFFAFAEKKFSDPVLVQETLKDLHLSSAKSDVPFYANRLSFSEVDRQGTFRGSFTDSNGHLAERFLAAHLQNFLEAEINKALAVQASEVSLMRSEFEKSDQELAALERELRDFKEQHLHVLPENAMGQLQAKGTLLGQRDQFRADVGRLTAQLALAQSQLASEDTSSPIKTGRAAPYEQALTQTKQAIAAALARGLAEGHPEVVRLREEERRTEALRTQAINAQTTELDLASNPEHKRLKDLVGQLRVQLAASQQELSQVESRLGEIEKISTQQPEVEGAITKLVRQAAAAKEIHERLHLDLKGKELDLQFERASVAARYEIMHPPYAIQPARSSTFIKLGGIGTGAGLMVGILLGALTLLIDYARKRKQKVTPPQALTRVG